MIKMFIYIIIESFLLYYKSIVIISIVIKIHSIVINSIPIDMFL